MLLVGAQTPQLSGCHILCDYPTFSASRVAMFAAAATAFAAVAPTISVLLPCRQTCCPAALDVVATLITVVVIGVAAEVEGKGGAGLPPSFRMAAAGAGRKTCGPFDQLPRSVPSHSAGGSM